MAISRRQVIFGVGPAGVVISFVLLAIGAWADRALGHPAILANPARARVAGCVLAVIGVALLLWSLWTLRSWWVKNELCATGAFRWFRHPVYAAWITFILPAMAFYLNSWTILFFVVLLHPVWHRLVIREEKMMVEKFGDGYRAYAARTGRFFPRTWTRETAKSA
jgi:protein-S-isoprenylcysteine O-methyltransferase Ste14